MNLRTARPDESDWVNEQYAAVGFIPSDASHIVVIAEIDGERAGLGRLTGAELGGMLVFEPFRGRGVARAIIDELLRIAGGRDVYCIPFAELESLYTGAGFARTNDAPREVLQKYAWCTKTYDKPVLLMKRVTSESRPGVLR